MLKRIILSILMLGFVTQAVSVKATILTPEARLNAAVERTFSEEVKKGVQAIAVLGALGIGAYGFSHFCYKFNLNIDDSLVLGLMTSSLVSLGYIAYQEYKESKNQIPPYVFINNQTELEHYISTKDDFVVVFIKSNSETDKDKITLEHYLGMYNQVFTGLVSMSSGIAQVYNVTSAPTILFFHKGKLNLKLEGFVHPSQWNQYMGYPILSSQKEVI